MHPSKKRRPCFSLNYRKKNENAFSCSRISDRGLKNLATGCSFLREIDLSWVELITDHGITALTENCQLLTSIIICGTSITDEALIAVGRKIKRLEELSISHCSQITDHGIIPIARNCRNLTHLHAARCTNVGWPSDAVFRRVGTFVHNLARKLSFSNDELHIILKRRNFEIGEHSSFFYYYCRNLQGWKFSIENFVNNWKKLECSPISKFLFVFFLLILAVDF